MVCLGWSRLTPEVLLLVSVYLLPISLLQLPPTTSAEDGPSSSIISRREILRVRNKRDGSWSEWSSWSPCSRSCGGGLRTQTRQCQIRKTKSKSSEATSSDVSRYARNVSSRHCEGHATRHHLCNIQECPVGTFDFRESQCKAFDNRPFMGKVYQWESFIDERSPCSLTCRAKGFRFFATLNKSVIDGTPCTKPTQLDLHVCIAGACTPIGCDGVAGSTRRLDMCGVCGGDNSTYRLVSGLFTRPQLSLGHNMVAHIPKGACALNITELRTSANHLALRRQDGTYIFNGDFRQPSWPGVYDGAGTKFQYSWNDLKKVPESISSAGPLKEAVDLMVVYQQPNPGIRYEYILPQGEGEPLPPVPLKDTPVLGAGGRMALEATSRPGSYMVGPQQLVSRPASTALKSLGGGAEETSQIQSLPRHHHHLHGHHGRRRGHPGGAKRDSGDNPGNKKFYWKITGYSNCSELCGGGTQRAIIRCVRAPHGNPVGDRRCTADQQEKPPGQTIRCNLKPCPAEWVVGDWSNCSVDCGAGLKTRQIHCQQRVSPTLTMRVSEAACLQQKPAVRASCQLKSCHEWQAGEWSQCSARCGNGVRKRNVTCVDSTRANGSGSCNSLEKPAELKPCNMGPCTMDADWFVSEWSSECSQRCGAGIQTRHVVCSGILNRRGGNGTSAELESNTIEDGENGKTSSSGESFCDESRKPDAERECFSERSCGEAVWFTGPWGKCSVFCGKGLRTRQVLCIIFSRSKFKVVTESLCPLQTKPEEKQFCDSTKACPARWFTTDWSECSASCGGGTQKRSVSCRASNWTSPSTLCSDKDRPIERRSCNEQKCSLALTTPTSSQKPARNSDLSRMIRDRDKPLQQQAAGPIVLSTSTPSPPRSTSTNRTAILNDKPSVGKVVLRSSSSSSTTIDPSPHQELNEEPEDAECSDQYRNCALVVQARLCRYKYYRSVCCNSCADADAI